MADQYGQEPAYQVAARLFSEPYRVVDESTQAKANKEISASSLQSLDDLEATYREKNRVGYKGYVANVTETCDPENNLQLITAVQVAPNTAEDGALLAALPELKRCTDLDTLYTDGAYGGPQSDPVLREQQVTLIQTAIVGPKPNPEKLHLADFAITQDAQGIPRTITCKQGQTVPVTPGQWQVYYLGFARAGWTPASHAFAEEIASTPPSGKNWCAGGMRLVGLAQVDRDLAAWVS